MGVNGLRKLVTITIPALAVAVAVVMAGIEVWVRLAWNPKNGQPGLFVYDPVRGQRFAPDYDGWFAGVPVRINNLGFRDSRDYTLEKPANAFRIVFLGDSVTFGHGSIYEHTYPYLLEQRLKAWRPDIGWQVWNVAVPGYNTRQELDHLNEIGPRFSPDLVIVGFFENDLVDNHPPAPPSLLRVAAAPVLSFAQRHIYSAEFYRKAAILLAWKLSSSDAYRQRLEQINDDEKSLRKTGALADAKQQELTKFDYVSDEERVRSCRKTPPSPRPLVDAIQRQDGYTDWINAVRGFQELNRSGRYHVVFFLNVPPMQCPDGDAVFWDEGADGLNAFFMKVFADGTPTVSTHDALLHTRPSQMPGWAGHSFGNTNVVKADVLFSFLRGNVFGTSVPLPQIQTSAAAR